LLLLLEEEDANVLPFVLFRLPMILLESSCVDDIVVDDIVVVVDPLNADDPAIVDLLRTATPRLTRGLLQLAAAAAALRADLIITVTIVVIVVVACCLLPVAATVLLKVTLKSGVMVCDKKYQ
jgi:hypothetical protein